MPTLQRPVFDALPMEIVRLIMREATKTHNAFDTSLDAVVCSSRGVCLHEQWLGDSFKTKLALSLVSHEFHAIVEEYLFECIRMTRDRDVIQLSTLIPAPSCPNPSILRGQWCRKINYYPCRGQSERVLTGTESFQKLSKILASCPNLEILLMDIPTSFSHNFQLPDTFWGDLVNNHRKTLRSLALSTVKYDARQVACTIPHLDFLESLSIDGECCWTIPDQRTPFWVNGHHSCTTHEFPISSIYIDYRFSTTDKLFERIRLDKLRFANVAIHRNPLRPLDWDTSDLLCISKLLPSIPPTLTHFKYSGPAMCLADLATHCPRLELIWLPPIELTTKGNYYYWEPSTFGKSYFGMFNNLHTICISRFCDDREYDRCELTVRPILHALAKGDLEALRLVVAIYSWFSHKPSRNWPETRQRFADFGVSFEVLEDDFVDGLSSLLASSIGP